MRASFCCILFLWSCRSQALEDLPLRIQKLEASSQVDGLRFGAAFSIEGNRALIARAEVGSNDTSLHLFTRDVAGLWMEQSYSQNTEIGWVQTVASVSETAFVLGTPLGTERSGGAVGGAWITTIENDEIQSERLPRPSSLAEDARMGYAVSANRDYVFVGAPGVLASEPGRLLVYRLDEERWRLVQDLRPPEGGSGFGVAVAATSDRIAVSARAGRQEGEENGLVCTYVLNGGVEWSLEGCFGSSPQTQALRTSFGESLAFCQDHLLVGAPLEGNGAIYSFQRGEEAWLPKFRFEREVESGLGSAIDCEKEVVIAGAGPSEITPSGRSIELLRLGASGELSVSEQTLLGEVDGASGLAVGVSSGQMFIGAPEDGAGAVFVLDF